jgi:rhodanese-related sulfurtransferase
MDMNAPLVTPAALDNALAAQAHLTLLDVRTPAEFAAGHIAGSINVPVDEVGPGAAPGDTPVVLVCKSGARAQRAFALLGRPADPQVFVLDGGVDAWRESGRPLAGAVGERTGLRARFGLRR